jgi:hypothetical protein
MFFIHHAFIFTTKFMGVLCFGTWVKIPKAGADFGRKKIQNLF